MPRKPNQTIDRIQVASEAYVTAVLDYCTANKLQVRRVVASMLDRPQAVRVGKMASFEISGTKYSDLFTTDELYYVTNKAYNRFKQQLEVDVLGVVDDALLASLKQ